MRDSRGGKVWRIGVLLLTLCHPAPGRASSAEPVVPLQKLFEAADGALEEGDFSRLGELGPYLSPHFASARTRMRDRDLRPAYAAAVGRRSGGDVEAVLTALAYADIRSQLDFPADAQPESLQPRVQLAYLDYHFALSKRLKERDIARDGYIRNCFQRSFQAPRSPWPGKILETLAAAFPAIVEAESR